nr:hypothetical protein [Petropleomorpha daqingensis]
MLGVCSPAGAAPAGAADDPGDRHVVVVGVPGLAWSDLDPQQTPELWDLAGSSAIGALSVRAARGTSCLLDGWATLGAGNRARFPGADEQIPPVPLPSAPLPDGENGAAAPTDSNGEQADPSTAVDASLSHCGLQEQIASLGLADPVATVGNIAEDEATARFGAVPGLLGEQVGCAGVAGKAASLSVAAEGVKLTSVDGLPADPAAISALLSACPLTVVSLDSLTDAGKPGVDATDTGTDPNSRPAALRAIDAAVGRLRAALPPDTLLVIAGISEVNDGRPQLHVAIASGPGYDQPTWLTSSSTGRTPFVQLIDLAPTALSFLGLDRPASMNGEPMRAAGERPPLAEAVTQLDRSSTAAAVHYRSTSDFFWTLVVVNAVVVALGLLVLGGWRVARWGRRAAPRPVGSPARRALRVLAGAAAALPVATYLGDLLPWEAAGSPRWALVGVVVLADVLVTAVALLGPWRRHQVGPPLALLAITLGTLFGDVLTGSNLELDGLLGYDPIVAGRFIGYGNLSFGLLVTCGLLLTTAAATWVGGRGGSRWAVAGTVLGCGVVVVALDGAPQLGRDFGGVLASVPGFLLLAMLLTRTRVTVARLLAILGVAVVAVGTVAYLDWLRPADQRTHLGRFVDQILSGEAWTVISRKGQANLDILLGSSLAWMLPVALVAAWWLVRPGGLLRGGSAGGLSAPHTAALKSGLLAVALSLTLGAAVNDSGVAVPATAAALLVPLLVWLAAAPDREGNVADGTALSGQEGSAHRVTVVSRGSTVSNA